jgi:iron(III) transport system permease protein
MLKRAFDPVLAIGLTIAMLFVSISIIFPLYKMLISAADVTALPYFERFLLRPSFQQIIGRTIVLGVCVAIAGTSLGFIFAYFQARIAAPQWLKKITHWVALVPVVSPPFAVAIAVITLFGRRGVITYKLLGLEATSIYGLLGMTLVMALSFFPAAYLNLLGLMRALDPALDEASTNLGGNRWHTFRRVTLPMLAPGIASSLLLLFVEAIADLGNPLTIGGDYVVLAVRLFIAIQGEYDILAGAVLSVILLVPSLIVYLIQKYWADRASVISVTGKPTGTHILFADWRVRVPIITAVIFTCALIILIYATIFVGAFTVLLGIDNTFTLNNFIYVISGVGQDAFSDTTLLSAIATPIAGMLGMLIAFLVVRRNFFGRAALDFGTMLGIAVPGTIFGIGYLLAFNDPITIGGATIFPKLTGSRGIFGGAFAIVLIYIIRSAPAALRAGVAALQQIDPTIEEASTSLGADTSTTFRKITLPLIRPAFFSGLIYAFSRSMTTISAVIFLTTPETKIMTQQIYNETDANRFGNAFAYVVVLIVIVLVVIALLSALIGLDSGVRRRSVRSDA